jgi:3-oxoadipate enol-lactonase
MELPEGRRVRLPGRGTTYVREVPGPPGAPTLMLLHGLGATGGLNWFACFEALGRHYRVLAPDQRGHGRGIRPGLIGFRLQDCADDAVALADALDIERMVCVGYSMGGPVSQLVWRRHPDRLAGLVLCATAGTFRGRQRPDFAQAVLAQAVVVGGLRTAAAAMRMVPTAVRRQIVRTGVHQRGATRGLPPWAVDELARNDPACLLEAARSLTQFTSSRWIGDAHVPACVVVTTEDGLVPPARQRALAAALPSCTVIEVAGDHAVCGSNPGIFVPALVEACRRVTTTGGRSR